MFYNHISIVKMLGVLSRAFGLLLSYEADTVSAVDRTRIRTLIEHCAPSVTSIGSGYHCH
jgi:hypothetical protein